MNKNTLTGLVLMMLVFFIFMWLQPKPEPKTAQEAQETEAVDQSPAAMAATPDTLSPNEKEWLVKNIVSHGKMATDDAGRVSYTVQENGLTLSVTGDSISGNVTVEGTEYPWSSIVNPSAALMPVDKQRKAMEMVKVMSASMGKYGKFSRFLTGDDKEVKLENDVLSLTFSAKGGTVTYAELKKYDSEYNADETKKEKKKVVLFNKENNSMAFALPLPQEVVTSDLYFTPTVIGDSIVEMALNFDGGARWALRYTLPKGESYVVNVDVVQKDMEAIAQSNNKRLGLIWHQQLRRQEKGKMFEERNSALYYKLTGGSVENLSESKNDQQERKVKVKWIGFKNQFFSSVIVSRDNSFASSVFDSKMMNENPVYLKGMSAESYVDDYEWGNPSPASFSLFLGPNLYPLLSSLDDQIQAGEDLKMTRMIPLGWSIFRWINTGIVIPVFNFLGGFITNYGIIILILTFFIKIVLFPFTFKSYKSQAKMRVLAPDIKAINDKYPGQDKAMERQRKTMELYSKAGASPMSGCLPMLLQMPILFAMFSFFPSCIELRGESFLWVHDLSAPDAIISWSGNIPLITKYFGNHISLFCLLMTVTNIMYTYINMQSQPSQMPGMKWMMYLMPVMFMVFFNNYAAGLSYYYFLSLLITIVQTYAFRYIIKEEDVRKAMAENAKKPRKKSGFMARLEQMQKEQQKMLAEQQKRNGRR